MSKITNYGFVKNLVMNILDDSYNEAIDVLYQNISVLIAYFDIIKKKGDLYFNNPNIDFWSLAFYYLNHEKEIDESLLPYIITSIFCYGIEEILLFYKNMTVNNQTEIIKPINNINYHIMLGDSPAKLKLFTLFVIMFNLESNISDESYYVGMDYEFNNRKIALMQTSFERYVFKNKQINNYIWIIYPPELSKDQTQYLIEYIMISPTIKKICHGSDSLDIPYLFQELFQNDLEIIKKFIENTYDTRFLCEYYKNSVNDEKKCSIYDALKYFGTINNEKYVELNGISDGVGPNQDIIWNIHKMSSYHIKYAFYDVYFLKQFLIDIHTKAKNETPTVYPSYTYIDDVTRFLYMEKKELVGIINDIKKEIDPLNNYLIKSRNNITLVNVFSQTIENMIISEIGVHLNYLLGINYFKSYMTMIFKKIVYYILTINYDIYKNKQEKFTDKLEVTSMYKKISDAQLNNLVKMLVLFQKEAYHKINTLLH